MNITNELLAKLTKDFVAKRARQEKDLVAIYLTGSTLRGDPLLGGTTDIDLVFVHKENPEFEREVQRISYEVSFDIQHHHQSYYTFHRRLRLNPWLGEALNNRHSILYDTDHWLEFIQAGVGNQYLAPESVYNRALPFAEKARSQWFDLEDPQDVDFANWADLYFKSVYSAANAVAVLAGPALTTRRLLLDFPARAEAVNRLPLVGDLARLIGSDMASLDLYQDWRPAWEAALISASQADNCPPNLHSSRRGYFISACDAMAESGSVHAALWPVIETWRLATQTLSGDLPLKNTWLGFLDAVGFIPDTKADHVQQLDQFLDQAEAALADWKAAYGL